MVEIPDNIKPYLNLVSKYHFWLLALLMPLVLVPLAFTADATLIHQIDKRQTEVKGKLKAVEQLAQAEASGFEELGHPQEQWAKQLDRTTEQLRQQVYEQWNAFWEQQQELRVWPPELRGDFIRAITRLKPGEKLAARFVERYQNTVRQLVKKLPARIDADEQMQESNEAGRRGGGRRFAAGPEPGGVDEEVTDQHLVSWDAADQSELYASFSWQTPPSTKQILLAQEELWVYETLCDALAAANAAATGPHNATIASISRLAIGYRAAQGSPSGRGGGRVQRVAATAGGMGMDMGMGPGMGMGLDGGENAGPPPNPRFSGSGQMMGMPMEEFPADGFGVDDAAEDDSLRNWIYVDATGRPLTAEEIAESPDTKLAHLMPFVIRGKVDQRKLDLLLRTLAAWPVPINVRQVRINPENTAEPGGAGRRMMRETMPGEPNNDSFRRYDVTVELRGMIALATPPDKEFLGLSDQTTAAADLSAEE